MRHLLQRVNEITRYRLITTAEGSLKAETSCLDHIYTSDALKTEVMIIPTAWSDHEIILSSIRVHLPYKLAKSKTRMRIWKTYNVDKLIDGVNREETEDTVALQKSIYNTLEKLCPMRVVRFKA